MITARTRYPLGRPDPNVKNFASVEDGLNMIKWNVESFCAWNSEVGNAIRNRVGIVVWFK